MVLYGQSPGVFVTRRGRLLGLTLTALMFAFSAFMFTETGDWVAAVFAAGSLAYALFFLLANERKDV